MSNYELSLKICSSPRLIHGIDHEAAGAVSRNDGFFYLTLAIEEKVIDETSKESLGP